MLDVKDPAAVLEGRLFVGSANACLTNLRITGSINCAQEVANLNSNTLRLEWREVAGERLADVRERVLVFWDAEQSKADGAVLVNCAAGKSRSVAVALMIMTARRRMSLKEAFETLFRERPCIEPNADLWQQMLEMTGAPAGMSQESCKAVMVPARLPNTAMSATDAAELGTLFKSFAAVRKTAFHVDYSGVVTAEVLDMLLRGRPSCVSIVTLRQCSYEQPEYELALRRKLCFVIEK